MFKNALAISDTGTANARAHAAARMGNTRTIVLAGSAASHQWGRRRFEA